MSVIVNSQATPFPVVKRKSMMLSGRFPSPQSRPTGFRIEEYPARSSPRLIRLFRAAWRGSQSELTWQERRCSQMCPPWIQIHNDVEDTSACISLGIFLSGYSLCPEGCRMWRKAIRSTMHQIVIENLQVCMRGSSTTTVQCICSRNTPIFLVFRLLCNRCT